MLPLKAPQWIVDDRGQRVGAVLDLASYTALLAAYRTVYADVPQPPAADSQPNAPQPSLFDLIQPIAIQGWSADSRFGRDELYGDDGR